MDRQVYKAYLCGSLKNTKISIVQLIKTKFKRTPATAPLRLGLLTIIAAGLAVPALGKESNADTALELSPCELSLPGTGLTAPAECGWFEVAENPAEPEGRKIKLRVARVPAQGRNVEPDPLVLFAGGPGQAASESWLIIAGALRKLNKSRDVLLVDQRGTGQSNPLRCPQMEIAEALAVDWDQLGQTTQACLDGLDGDPRYYTTTIAMGDYDQVREALGYDQLNLFGVSYGTRAAQVYLRLYPEHVRSVVLDSVAPQTLALGSEHAIKLDQALKRVLESCEADSQCNTAYPDIPGSLDLLVQRLDDQPVSVTVAHPLTGIPFTFEYDRDALASTIRFLTYSPETQAMLPLLINEAAGTQNYQRLASQMLITASGLTDSISAGMELSVICAEDFPLFPDDDGGVSESKFLMGDSMLKASRIQCGIWPRGSVPDDFHDPVISDKPTLLLSGELDPVTPPEYADLVSENLSRSLHLVAPGQGHSVTGRGCTGDLVSEFIIAGHFDELETDCLGQLEASPWFMSLTGPNP
jgi:pimeloyl-ACP methyl ester carboxylesterase